MIQRFLFIAFSIVFCIQANAQEVRAYIDLQLHPCIHIPYPFFGKGLQFFNPQHPPVLRYKHLFTNVNYANYLRKNKGARILVVGALTQEYWVSAKRGRKMIMKQIEYVNRFADANSADFAVARSPQEVRNLVHTTDKTIFIHSIEGGKRLINSQADAHFWASQGVAFVTVLHLVDSRLGGAAIRPGFITTMLNFRGLFRKKENRGLTGSGKQVIVWLANAGVMTDLTHMNDQTRKDALTLMEEKGIAPLVTHDMFRPIHNHPRGIDEADVLRIYRNKGLMSLPISGLSCSAYKPRADYRAKIEAINTYCDGSIDSYKFSYEALNDFLEQHVGDIFGDSIELADLDDEALVDIAIGFQTDFNGWVNHHRPRYGPDGCSEISVDSTYEAIEIEGLAHPGLLESHWQLLEKEGVDLAPIRRSSEKFLRMWQQFLDKRVPE